MSHHDPSKVVHEEPVLCQLASDDMTKAHAVTTMSNVIFDANYDRSLPCTQESLDLCVPGKTKFKYVARAYRLIPSKRAFDRRKTWMAQGWVPELSCSLRVHEMDAPSKPAAKRARDACVTAPLPTTPPLH